MAPFLPYSQRFYDAEIVALLRREEQQHQQRKRMQQQQQLDVFMSDNDDDDNYSVSSRSIDDNDDDVIIEIDISDYASNSRSYQPRSLKQSRKRKYGAHDSYTPTFQEDANDFTFSSPWKRRLAVSKTNKRPSVPSSSPFSGNPM